MATTARRVLVERLRSTPRSGRTLFLERDEPGVQRLDGLDKGARQRRAKCPPQVLTRAKPRARAFSTGPTPRFASASEGLGLGHVVGHEPFVDPIGELDHGLAKFHGQPAVVDHQIAVRCGLHQIGEDRLDLLGDHACLAAVRLDRRFLSPLPPDATKAADPADRPAGSIRRLHRCSARPDDRFLKRTQRTLQARVAEVRGADFSARSHGRGIFVSTSYRWGLVLRLLLVTPEISSGSFPQADAASASGGDRLTGCCPLQPR